MIGINIISKIGVIFIIIGIIAFSVAAAPVLNGIALSLIIYSAGLVLGGAGEFFYRRGNKAFSLALTMGCIAEAFITTLISSLKLEAFGSIAAAFISLLIGAGGILLSLRYKSRVILSVTAVCGMIMVFAVDGTLLCGVIMMLYLLIFQSALTVVSIRKSCVIPLILALFFNTIAAAYLSGVYINEISSFCADIAYIFLSFSIYTAAVLACEFRGISIKKELSTVLLIASSVFTALFAIILFTVKFNALAAGAAVLVLGIIYIVLAVISRMNSKDSAAANVFWAVSIMLLLLANYLLLKGRYSYIAAHLFGAALFVFGVVRSKRMFRDCGIAVLITAQLNFMLISIVRSYEPIYFIQYSLNILVWVGILIFLTRRRCKGNLFTAYTITVYCDCSFYLIFVVSNLMIALNSAGLLSNIAVSFSQHYYAAVIFMLLAFLLAGRADLGKASAAASETVHISALLYLGIINLCLSFGGISKTDGAGNIGVSIACVIACAASVFAALNLALTIQRQNPKFSKAVGLIVSGYAVITATYLLSVNDIIAFTSCIISIIYILLAAAWIVIGFLKENPLLRRCGLALVLFSCVKLFLFDFSNIGDIGRTAMFIGFGIALLCISMIYGFFEAKMRKK